MAIQKVWIRAAVHPRRSVSEKLKFAIPMRMNRKLKDIVPRILGRRIFCVEAAAARKKKAANRAVPEDCQCDRPRVRRASPAAAIEAM